MQSWTRSREIEKPKPQSADLLSALNHMDAWLANDESIQSLCLEDIIVWREAVARHLQITDDWFTRMEKQK